MNDLWSEIQGAFTVVCALTLLLSLVCVAVQKWRKREMDDVDYSDIHLTRIPDEYRERLARFNEAAANE